MSVRAIRGATQVEANTAEAIAAGTKELLSEILRANALPVENVISVLLTATPDLNAAFPAAAAREVGFQSTPLLCAVEIDVHPLVYPVWQKIKILLTPDVSQNIDD